MLKICVNMKLIVVSRFEDALRDLQEGSVITMSGRTIRLNQVTAR